MASRVAHHPHRPHGEGGRKEGRKQASKQARKEPCVVVVVTLMS